MLSRIFRPKKDEVTRQRGKLHIEDFNILYSSPNIVRMIKSRRMRHSVMGRAREVGQDRVLVGET